MTTCPSPAQIDAAVSKPADWESKSAFIRGTDVHYKQLGPKTPSNKPTALFLHGLDGSHGNVQQGSAGLALGRNVIAPDLRGFGYTQRGDKPATVEENVLLVEEFVERVVGRRVDILGNSMGGAIAAQLAAKRPDLVNKLVGINPAWLFTPSLRGLGGLRHVAAMSATRVFGTSDMRHAHLMALCAHQPETLASFAVEYDREVYKIATSRPDYDKGFAEAAQSLIAGWMMNPLKTIPMLRQIERPVFLMQGDKDNLVPVATARFVHHCIGVHKGWKYDEWANFGHVLMIEDAARFTRNATQFLDEV